LALPSRHAYSASSANKILKLGLLFFVLQCAVAAGYTSDNLVIAQVLGAAAVAAYAVPEKLFSFVAMVVGIWASVRFGPPMERRLHVAMWLGCAGFLWDLCA
jgi:O-antigen/teichoic acid export membrane protein